MPFTASSYKNKKGAWSCRAAPGAFAWYLKFFGGGYSSDVARRTLSRAVRLMVIDDPGRFCRWADYGCSLAGCMPVRLTGSLTREAAVFWPTVTAIQWRICSSYEPEGCGCLKDAPCFGAQGGQGFIPPAQVRSCHGGQVMTDCCFARNGIRQPDARERSSRQTSGMSKRGVSNPLVSPSRMDAARAEAGSRTIPSRRGASCYGGQAEAQVRKRWQCDQCCISR